jgi:two-component system alkaline phosphatase synthesis response regulator PhoP
VAKILIAEDDEASRSLLAKFLTRQGHEVFEAVDGSEALELVPRVDCALLDVMMPKLDGWQVIDALRAERPDMPVIMLTALASTEHQVKGLDLGADDYVTKPFDLRALDARIRALLRRSRLEQEIVRGELRIVPSERAAYLGDAMLSLTNVEYELLLALAQHPGRLFSRDRLLERIWGPDYFGLDRVVDVRMVALRRKLGEDGRNPRFIETVRGQGYRFRVQDDDSEPA